MARPGVTTRTARALYAPVPVGGRGQDIARRLEEGIRLGVIEAGARLPSETVLAEQFNVSPLTLRDALALLRDRGLVQTRRGRGGGTFVLAPSGSADEHLASTLLGMSPQELQDLGDHRAAVAAAAARLAALRALPPDLDDLRRALERFDAGAPIGELRRADARFHVELAAAAQSPRLTEAEMSLWAQIGDLPWFAVPAADRASVVAEHTAILGAVESGDPGPAHDVATRHVDAETHRLLAVRGRLAAEAASG